MIQPDSYHLDSDSSHLTECRPRQTVGEAALELIFKGDQKQGVIDTQREMTKGYIDQLIICAKAGMKAYPDKKPFYICVQTRRERLLHNVIRNQFYHRMTRPLPTFDLALYHFDPADEQLRFVWCIPDKETVEIMSSPDYKPTKGEEQLHYFVKCFMASTLI